MGRFYDGRAMRVGGLPDARAEKHCLMYKGGGIYVIYQQNLFGQNWN
jgi:hypothetical protein